MISRILILGMIVGSGLVACGEDQDPDARLELHNPAPSSTSAEEGTTTTPATTTGEPTEPLQLDPPTAFTQWCSPRPVSYDTAAIPALPAEVKVEGFCSAETPEPPFEESIQRQFTLDASANTIEVISGELSESFASYTFDSQGRVRHVFAEGMRGFYGQGQGRSWYDLNTTGEMVHKVAETLFLGGLEEERQILVKAQEWDGDRLIRRTERQGHEGPIVREFTWTWDGDRLQSASLLDLSNPEAPRTAHTRWAYSAQGLPLHVERRLNDQTVEFESWLFDQDGRLTERTYWAPSRNALSLAHGGHAYEWVFPEGLDSMQNPSNIDTYSHPWKHALPVQQGDCAVLPHGPGHGYPEAERHYRLGVATEDRPTRIGRAYGNNDLTWDRGDRSWFGHLGLGSDEAMNLRQRFDFTHATVHYDTQGRMIRSNATVHVNDEVIDFVRERHYEANQLLQDTATINHTDTYVLAFAYTPEGRLTRRTLHINEDPIKEHSWTYNEDGHLTKHTVFLNHNPWGDAVVSPTSAPFFGQDAPNDRETSWLWRYEGDLLVERFQSNIERIHQTLEYDDQGRLTAVTGVFRSLDFNGRESWSYDDEGRAFEHCSEGSNHQQCIRTAWDSQGRVAWRSAEYNGEGPIAIEHNLYLCP